MKILTPTKFYLFLAAIFVVLVFVLNGWNYFASAGTPTTEGIMKKETTEGIHSEVKKPQEEVKIEKVFPEENKKISLREPSLNINPEGKVNIVAGEISEANWPNLKIKVWGLLLSVHVMPYAKLEGGGSDVQANSSVGDKVDLKGYVDRDSGLIHAEHFKNTTLASRRVTELQEKIRQLQEQLRQLLEQLKLELNRQ